MQINLRRARISNCACAASGRCYPYTDLDRGFRGDRLQLRPTALRGAVRLRAREWMLGCVLRRRRGAMPRVESHCVTAARAVITLGKSVATTPCQSTQKKRARREARKRLARRTRRVAQERLPSMRPNTMHTWLPVSIRLPVGLRRPGSWSTDNSTIECEFSLTT